jgi:putative peptide zinc metalloprotease protein
MAGNTLSDAWYQVAASRVALLPSVRVQPQRFRGQPWIMLEDPYSHRYFRVTPEAYGFLRALHADETVDAIWRRMAAEHPQATPGQDEVVRLLSQLHLSSLLYFREQPLAEAIYERTQKQKQRELVGKLLAFLYVRIPLFSPDRWLDGIQPLIRATTGPLAALVWLVVVGAGAVTAFDRRAAIGHGGEGLLALSNLPWLYLALTLVKVVHEFAHAFVCKRYGGHVPTFGLMLLVLAPLPYVDASASWGLRDKWQRAYVGAAGMLAELFLAALAAMVWAATRDGLLNSLAFNMMVVGSVSSLLFNGNPLLRFDAYYILSDLVEMPNLYQKAQAQWMHYGARWLLAQQDSVEPASDATERVWFTVYGALAFVYRLTVTFGVLLYVTDQWYAVGLLMLGTTAIAMLLMPLSKLWGYLRSPALRRRRFRACLGLTAAAGLVYGGVFVLPMPYALRLPGVLEARQSSPLYTQAPGTLVELPLRHGQRLKAGALVARFENPELQNQIEITRWQMVETRAQLGQALTRASGEVDPLQARLGALVERLRELETLASQLVVRAPQDGEWVAPQLHERIGTWVERGQALGEVVDRTHFRFAAVLPQAQAAELFGVGVGAADAGLRLAGLRSQTVPVEALELVPFQRQRLMSPALGFSGGGEVAVRPEDSSGTLTSEPFFEIHAAIADAALPHAVAYHGMTGVLRVPVEPRPWGRRAWAALQQLLQRRYGA